MEKRKELHYNAPNLSVFLLVPCHTARLRLRRTTTWTTEDADVHGAVLVGCSAAEQMQSVLSVSNTTTGHSAGPTILSQIVDW